MDKFEEEVEEIIEHKITKVSGEVGFKKYSKSKMLGKGTRSLIPRRLCQMLRRHELVNQADVRHKGDR